MQNKHSYKIAVSFESPVSIPVRAMLQGQIARIESGPDNMAGEIIVCNVMGWFTLGTDRYWPSEYAALRISGTSYVPDFIVRPLGKGETITITG